VNLLIGAALRLVSEYQTVTDATEEAEDYAEADNET